MLLEYDRSSTGRTKSSLLENKQKQIRHLSFFKTTHWIMWTASYIHAIQFIDAPCQKALGPRLHQRLFSYPLHSLHLGICFLREYDSPRDCSGHICHCSLLCLCSTGHSLGSLRLSAFCHLCQREIPIVCP